LAREFYDRIVGDSDPVAAIRRLINSDPPTAEMDHFDCKQEDRGDAKKRDQKTKEVWSELLGGFANAGGGVVIWGLDARKTTIDGREVDAVSGEVPVANPRAFSSRLRELQRQATDPPLGNVEITAYPLPGDDSRGFVVCLIPEGPHKPYRSEHAHKQYFLRLGDNTQVMNRSVLGSMFFPRSMAVFRVRGEAQRQYHQSGSTKVTDTVRVYLLNNGTATAKDVHVQAFQLGMRLEGMSLNPTEEWSHTKVDALHELRAKNYSIHPDQRVHICTVALVQNVELGEEPKTVWADFTLFLMAYCENQGLQVFIIEFDDEDFGDERFMRDFDPEETTAAGANSGSGDQPPTPAAS